MFKNFVALLSRWAEHNIFISTLLNRLYCLVWTFSFKNVYADRELSYDGFATDVLSDPPPLNDDRTNYFTRVILERGYTRIIEIGAYDLRRAKYYKRLFPDRSIAALDKIKGFEFERETDGLTIGPFDLDRFAHCPGSLVISCDTLAYFEPHELKAFLEHLRRNDCDLALAEPGSHFAKTRSLRRSVVSYFHPYVHRLQEVGFRVEGYPHPNHCFSLSAMARREYLLAINDGLHKVTAQIK